MGERVKVKARHRPKHPIYERIKIEEMFETSKQNTKWTITK